MYTHLADDRPIANRNSCWAALEPFQCCTRLVPDYLHHLRYNLDLEICFIVSSVF